MDLGHCISRWVYTQFVQWRTFFKRKVFTGCTIKYLSRRSVSSEFCVRLLHHEYSDILLIWHAFCILCSRKVRRVPQRCSSFLKFFCMFSLALTTWQHLVLPLLFPYPIMSPQFRTFSLSSSPFTAPPWTCTPPLLSIPRSLPLSHTLLLLLQILKQISHEISSFLCP